MALSLDLTLSDVQIRLEEIERLLRLTSTILGDLETLPTPIDLDALRDGLVLVNVSLGLFPPIQEHLGSLRKEAIR